MAAAIVPLIVEGIPIAVDLFNLIAGLVHKKAPAAESQFGQATGPVKFASVFSGVLADLQQAAAAGQISKQLPTDDTIKLVIQAVVSSMNIQGLLDTAPSVPSQNGQKVSLTGILTVG